MRNRIPLAFALPLIVMALAIVGCPQECDESWCQTMLTIDFVPALKTAGDYRISGTVDGQAFDCQLTLPAASSVTCSSAQWGVNVFPRAATATETPAIYGFHGGVNPAHIDINVERDMTSIGQASFDVAYERVRPNGESCPPECYIAQKTLSLHP